MRQCRAEGSDTQVCKAVENRSALLLRLLLLWDPTGQVQIYESLGEVKMTTGRGSCAESY
jgi:hypothetical protein